VNFKTIALKSFAAVLMISACGQSSGDIFSSDGSIDDLKAPNSITVATRGKICELMREGFEVSELASVAAIGDCMEQTAINGGRALWIEFSDLSSIKPDLNESELKYVMISCALSVAAYGFRISEIPPTEFEQIYFSFRDKKGSNFEVRPVDMQRLLPTKDMSQEQWGNLVETEVQNLISKITILTSP